MYCDFLFARPTVKVEITLRDGILERVTSDARVAVKIVDLDKHDGPATEKTRMDSAQIYMTDRLQKLIWNI